MAVVEAPKAESAIADDLRAFFDAFALEEPRWRRRNSFYHRLVEQIMRFPRPARP